MKRVLPLILLSGVAIVLAACATFQRGPVGNAAVPQPARTVDLQRYAGLWYEIGRYENGFERGCEGVTARYTLQDDGVVAVLNTCRQGGVTGKEKSIEGRARVTPGSGDAKLRVSFFGPFYGVLDRADDYSWSIVGEPSGRYLWILTREPQPSQTVRDALMRRTAELGYDLSLIRPTLQPPG